MKQRIRHRLAVALAGGTAAAMIAGTTTTAVASTPPRVGGAPAPFGQVVDERLRLPAPSDQSKISAAAFSTFRAYDPLPTAG